MDFDDFELSDDVFIDSSQLESLEIVYPSRYNKLKCIGNYVLGDVIGEGSYSKVREVLDVYTLQRRAMKIMKKKRLKKIPNGENNVYGEIKLLKRLNHKNVIKIIESAYVNDRDKLCIIMEYCFIVIHDLLELSPKKCFPIWQAHDYFCQLLDGLEYLHGMGVIHKDIKPGNLLLDADGVVKISDFGVSELLSPFSKHDLCKFSQGTPSFQPPEIAKGLNLFHGFKLDIWASGVTLYNFLTGSYPYEGENIYILFENIARFPLMLPGCMDELLQSLLVRLLDRNPETRYDVQRAKNHEWVRKKHKKRGRKVDIKKETRKRTSLYGYLESYHKRNIEGKRKTIEELIEEEERDRSHWTDIFVNRDKTTDSSPEENKLKVISRKITGSCSRSLSSNSRNDKCNPS